VVRSQIGEYIARSLHGYSALPDKSLVLTHVGGTGGRTTPPSSNLNPVDPADSVISKFNATYTVTQILGRNQYQQRGKRWLAPGSKSGMPGVVILDGRAYSHHGCDPLAGKHSHDAFGAFAVLEHKGDVRAAVRAAAESLGIEHKRPEAVVRASTAEPAGAHHEAAHPRPRAKTALSLAARARPDRLRDF
jgi:hypothetical protein